MSTENIQQRPNLQAMSSESNKKEQVPAKMTNNGFGNAQSTTNGDVNGNQANNPSCISTEKDQSSVTGICEGSNSEQTSASNQSHHLLELEQLTSAPNAFYESLTEEMDKRIMMLKKSLDRVLEMRVAMAELKLNLKEITSSELVQRAEELNTQLTGLEESHSKFNEMVLSLKHAIQPSVDNDTNKAIRDKI